MRIVVILGRVLDPRGIVVNRRAGRIFINREEYILQPADRCALEAALRIKDATGAEVIALPRTFLPDDDVLRQALATGADRAIYLTGGPLGADEALMTRVLTAAIAKLGGADLILTGATTMDTGQSQLGARLAEAMGWPQVLNAWAVETADGTARAVVQNGAGYGRWRYPFPPSSLCCPVRSSPATRKAHGSSTSTAVWAKSPRRWSNGPPPTWWGPTRSPR
jgi:electron transfer flavoprotein alpha/beta subunit